MAANAVDLMTPEYCHGLLARWRQQYALVSVVGSIVKINVVQELASDDQSVRFYPMLIPVLPSDQCV